MTKVFVSNQITITDLPLKYEETVKRTLTFANRDFFKYQRMGIRTPAEYKYWKLTKSGDLVIPRGCLGRLKNYLDKVGVKCEWQYDLVKLPAAFPTMKGELREFQKTIVDKVVQKQCTEGLIVAGTGSGKSLLGLELARRLSMATVILVPNTVLLEQWKGECEKFYGFTPSLIDADHKEIGDKLTIATFQSLMASDELLEKLADRTSILIVDEAHGIVSSERKRILKAFRPSFCFGLTATAERSDALGPAIELLLGKVIAEHEMTQCTPVVEVIRTNVDIGMYYEYNKIVDAIVDNKSRTKLVAGIVLGELLQGRKLLVLTKRVQMYKNIEEILPKTEGVFFIDSDDPARDALLKGFKDGSLEYKAIFGTLALLGTGYDLPSADTLVLAADVKSSVLTVQVCGRVLRLFKDKPTPKIIDLWDNRNVILSRQHFERRKVYAKKRWPINM